MSNRPDLVPNRARKVTTDGGDDGQRVDNFLLRHLPGLPRSRVYRILRKGEVRVNGGRVKPEYRLKRGDEVRIPPVRLPDPKQPVTAPDRVQQQVRERIVFEDSHLLVLNKPAGLAVHGGSGLSFGLIETLRGMYPQCREMELVHRLDRDTSGCLLVAKRRSALRALHQQLRERDVDKRYLLIAHGRWPGRERTIDRPLKKNVLQSGERIVRVDEVNGKSARTHFRPLLRTAQVSLVEARPYTGRTHQIRVHAACAGHPIVGDRKYGDADGRAPAGPRGRLFLHARSIEIEHPRTQQTMRFHAPLDLDWINYLERIEADGLPAAGL